MKQGIHDKDNPLMLPGSNSSNTNTNNNAGSPSSITSPIMGSMSQNASTSDLENPGSGNEEQIMVGGPMSGSMVVPTSWTPPSVEERESPNSESGMSPNHGMSSPNNGITSSASMYSMLPSQNTLAHNATVMKSEMSSPSAGSPGILPSYPVNNGTMVPLTVGGNGQQMQNYLSESSIQHHHAQHSSVMANNALWYAGAESEQNLHQLSHMSHRGINDSGYLK